MGNGRNLIDMVCEAYESPDGGEPPPPKPPKQQQQRRGQGGRGRGGKGGRGHGGRGGRGRGRQAAVPAAEGSDSVDFVKGMDVDGAEDQEGSGEDDDGPESFNFSEPPLLLVCGEYGKVYW